MVGWFVSWTGTGLEGGEKVPRGAGVAADAYADAGAPKEVRERRW